MIASVSGVVKALRSGAAVIEVGGVGLLVHIPARVAAGLTAGTSVSLQTSMVVREDALTLFGFESNLDREIFELLQTVTGIGPKVAQSALSVYESAELISAISHDQSEILERIPGLGKKGAQRVVLELREKVLAFDVAQMAQGSQLWRDQLTEALVGLGYSARESQERIDAIVGEYKDVSNESLADLLKAALAQGSR